jgi:hypothetical protein
MRWVPREERGETDGGSGGIEEAPYAYMKHGLHPASGQMERAIGTGTAETSECAVDWIGACPQSRCSACINQGNLLVDEATADTDLVGGTTTVTAGVSDNVIDTSYSALNDGIVFKLLGDELKRQVASGGSEAPDGET